MMRKLICAYLLLVLTLNISAQSAEINQLDSEGKKHGTWVLYLNYFWKEVSTKEEAVFYRYNNYFHGKDLINMGSRGNKNTVFEPFTDTSGAKGNPILLDGEYKSLNKKGELEYLFRFTKGEFQLYEEYKNDGKIVKRLDFSKKQKNDPNSYTIQTFNKEGNETCYLMSLQDGHYRAYETKCK